MFLLILLLEVMAALSLGMMISAAAATIELALAFGIPITIVSFVFAGFYSESSSFLTHFFFFLQLFLWVFQSAFWHSLPQCTHMFLNS